MHSKAFRRLKHKTQVFVAPEGDHYRTRLTHTIEVTQIARTVARALRLNEDLAEAVGLGHDLGHPPFGHIGEGVLDACLRERFGGEFRHYEHSLRVVDVLERDGAGLNLSDDVRDGILCHSGRAPLPRTLEGRIVRIVDRVAYINHDIDDARARGCARRGRSAGRTRSPCSGAPARSASTRSSTTSSSIRRRAGDIVQGAEAGAAMDELRTWMFEHVYLGPQRADRARADRARDPHALRALRGGPGARSPTTAGRPAPTTAQRVIDYLAGMTDRYCIRVFEELTVPESFAA